MGTSSGPCFPFFGYRPGSGVPRSHGNCLFQVLRPRHLLPKAAAPFHISTSGARGFQSTHVSLPTTHEPQEAETLPLSPCSTAPDTQSVLSQIPLMGIRMCHPDICHFGHQLSRAEGIWVPEIPYLPRTRASRRDPVP